jgi:hypothetical protein
MKAQDQKRMNKEKVEAVDAKISHYQEKKRSRKDITLLSYPKKTIKTFSSVVKQRFFQLGDFILCHKKLLVAFIVATLVAGALYVTPGAHQPHVEMVEDFIFLCIWWVGLGILSSIGLGTGLHTFVLYLGPYIAKVTLTATECGTIDFATRGDDSFVCPATGPVGEVTYWEILRKVQFEAFLWGVGTAIGELPPYFIARAARLSNMRVQSNGSEDPEVSNSLVDKLRALVPSILSNLGFFGILMFASIPNPLFDLAGITCGHFLVPFWQFFGATLIGKAVIKAHMQTLFVITVFHKTHLEWVVGLVESLVPPLQGKINAILEKERARLHRGAGPTGSKSPLQAAWDTLLLLMLAYFLISIVNASVQEYLMEKDDEKIAALRKERKLLDDDAGGNDDTNSR